MERAETLFGSYRRADANDPERYVAAIAAVLSLYEPDLMIEVTDPRTGIQNTDDFKTFMPQSGELKRYCDGLAAVKDRIQRLGALPTVDFNRPRLAAPPRRPGDLATVFVPKENPRYPQLVEWAKTADERLWKFDNRPGIYVSYDTWDQRAIVARREPMPNKLPLPEDVQEVLDHPAGAYQEAE